MSNQDYYQSFQQDASYKDTGVPPTGAESQNPYAVPPQYENHQNYPQGAPLGQYPPGQMNQGPENQPFYQNTQSTEYQRDPYQPATGDERGLAGAALGGVAGGVAGHQVNHGFLGTVGGAIVGSITESAIKKHKKKDEHEHEHHKHDSSSSDSDSGRSHGGRRGRGGFRRGRGRGRG